MRRCPERRTRYSTRCSGPALRAIQFDRNANTWSYNAAVNPNAKSELYEGDAGTKSLLLFPTSPGEGVQACPFCSDSGRAPAANQPVYAIAALRQQPSGDQTFGHPLVLPPGAQATLEYAKWKGHGHSMPVTVHYQGRTRSGQLPDIS